MKRVDKRHDKIKKQYCTNE